MRTEVELVAGVVPVEGGSIGAHLRRTFLAGLPKHEQPVAIDPRHAYVIAYYVHRFREVGDGWAGGD